MTYSELEKAMLNKNDPNYKKMSDNLDAETAEIGDSGVHFISSDESWFGTEEVKIDASAINEYVDSGHKSFIYDYINKYDFISEFSIDQIEALALDVFQNEANYKIFDNIILSHLIYNSHWIKSCLKPINSKI